MTTKRSELSPRQVLFDLSNIRTGGALQVAASFMDEIGKFADGGFSHRWPWLANSVVEASPEVWENVTFRSHDLAVRIMRGSPFARLRQGKPPLEFDASFMVFGPDYAPRRATTRIVGFADGTSLFPELAQVDRLGARVKHKLRCRVSRARFRGVDIVIVEAPHVADALVKRWGIRSTALKVVPNVLNGVFKDPGGPGLPGLPHSSVTRVCFPTRLHPHKNLNLLGPVARELKEAHDLEIEFVLTLTPEEWKRLPATTRMVSRTVGPLRISELPSLYASCQAAIFLSSNECFSVTPLEALSTGTPLIASERPFVKYVAGDAAWYCEPFDVASVARALSEAMRNTSERERRVEEGLAIAAAWPSARQRAASYLDIIDEAVRLGAAQGRAPSGTFGGPSQLPD